MYRKNLGKHAQHGRLFDFLYDYGTSTTKEIAEGLNLSIPYVVQLLRENLEDGIIVKSKDGRTCYYTLEEA